MTATKLRLVLIGLIAAMVAAFSFGGWLLLQQLEQTVRETDHARTDADMAATELQQLRRLKQQFDEQKDIIDRAKQIAASADQYRYQDQIINDISQYAKRYGLQISAFDFSAAGSTASPGSQPAVTGTKRTPFTITLKGPLAYSSFLKFLRDIEQNLTKIQVTSLALAPDKNPSNVTNPTISLEVYLKQ